MRLTRRCRAGAPWAQPSLTATTTTTDAKPTSFTFTIPVSSSVESGGIITATATPTIKPTNTSKFSNVGTIQAAPNPL
jgi:hypothetical protein